MASRSASLVQLRVRKAALPSWCNFSWPCRRALAPWLWACPVPASGSTCSRGRCVPGGKSVSRAWVAEGWMALTSVMAPWITRMVTYRTGRGSRWGVHHTQWHIRMWVFMYYLMSWMCLMSNFRLAPCGCQQQPLHPGCWLTLPAPNYVLSGGSANSAGAGLHLLSPPDL